MRGLRVRIWRDGAGRARAAWHKPPPQGNWLIRFLEGDLAADATFAAELLRQAEAIASGTAQNYRISGNGFAVALSPSQAAIYPHHDEDAAPLELPLAEFVRLVRRWRDVVSDRASE